MPKPRKVEEAAGTYHVTPKPVASKAPATVTPSTSSIRYADNATFRKAATKVFRVHEPLFRKLAK
jgi:hypothetical protein